MQSQPSKLFANREEADAFAATLPTYALGKTIQYESSTGSTNDIAAQATQRGAPHGLLVVTDQQCAGRGRRGRTWEAPPGTSLLFTILVRSSQLPQERFGWLSLTAGLSMAQGIKDLASIPVTIKWPNDIVVPAAEDAPFPWKKLGGILIEGAMRQGPQASSHFLIGVGINVSQKRTELPDLPKAPATSLLIESKQTISRQSILTNVLERLEKNLDLLAVDEGFRYMREGIEKNLEDWLKGRPLHVKDTAGSHYGQYAGLDDFGQLQLRNDKGNLLTFTDAEVLGAG